MTAIDPFRTLEISPGASQAEIKRAYRRLAKLYHPDSAGERALPRFLAIQAAYEMLVDEPGRPRSVGRTSSARPAPAPAWQADASRARATREAYRARTRRAAGSTGSAGSSGTAGAAGSTAEEQAKASTETNEPGRTDGAAGPNASASGRGDAPGSTTGGRSKRSSRRTKATIGSTSYDGADREPFDPAWQGATWYGAGSGTYWTINPKEYADPRKHGPEYLARSRRATSTAAEEPSAPEAPPGADASSGADAGATPEATAHRAGARPGDEVRPGPGPTAAGSSDQGPSGDDPSAGRSARPPVAAPRPIRPSAPPPRPFAAAAGSAAWPGSSDLQRAASTLPGRVIVGLFGWIPIALALAALIEAVPVCTGVSTVCVDPLTGGLWIVDLAVIALLVAVQRLGWIAAIGAAASFVVGLIATPVLLVLGGARTATGTASALTVVLVVAWLGGVALALSGRVDLPPWRQRRVR